MFTGSNRFPAQGDVIQVHYSSYLVDKAKLIESSRNNRGRPFEFALGAGQVRQGNNHDRPIQCILYHITPHIIS